MSPGELNAVGSVVGGLFRSPLHCVPKVALDTNAHFITRRTERHVKLH